MYYFNQLKLNNKLYILSKIIKKSKSYVLSHYNNYLFNNNYCIQDFKFNNYKLYKILYRVNKIAKDFILNHKPLAKIFNEKYFFCYNFFTNKYTLDPRPESELIIETAFKLQNINSVLDLGTGTGCLAICLASRFSNVIGIDNNIHCLHIAKFNAKRNNMNVRFLHNNWLKNWTKPIDLLVSNPPYLDNITANIKHDPKYALVGNLRFYEKISEKSHLFNHIILEINPKYILEIKKIFITKNCNISIIDEHIIYINKIL